MASDFKDIRKAIVKKIDDDCHKVGKVYGYDRSTFEKYPAVVVVPTDNEADYADNAMDKITMIFKIRIYYPINKESEHGAAETALEEVVDELLTEFRERKVLGSASDAVTPAPSIWEYEDRGEVVYRVAEITLRCIKYSSRS